MITRNHDGILVTLHSMRNGFDLNSILQMAVFRPTNNINEFRAKIWTIRGKLGPSEMNYRIYSNKRRGAYLIFRAISAALIWERRFFEGGAYLNIVPDKFTLSLFLFNGTLSIC